MIQIYGDSPDYIRLEDDANALSGNKYYCPETSIEKPVLLIANSQPVCKLYYDKNRNIWITETLIPIEMKNGAISIATDTIFMIREWEEFTTKKAKTNG
jgi:hypothetical protein